MKIKIEKGKQLPSPRQKSSHFEFCEALKALKLGDSFTFKVNSSHRTALSLAAYLLGKKFTTRKDGASTRIFRVT